MKLTRANVAKAILDERVSYAGEELFEAMGIMEDIFALTDALQEYFFHYTVHPEGMVLSSIEQSLYASYAESGRRKTLYPFYQAVLTAIAAEVI